MSHLGTNIRRLRELKHLGIGDLAAHVGIHVQELQAIEEHQAQVSSTLLTRIAAALETQPADLFEEPPPSEGASVLIPASQLSDLLQQMQNDDGKG